MTPPQPLDEPAFAALYRSLARRVFAYALRHSDDSTAQDVVSETFLIAWRRRAELPDDPLPWLLVVARNTLSNRRRREQHQDRLARSVGRLEQVASAGADHDVIERQVVLAALAELSAFEREALLLVAWDGLTNSAAAQVAGCSVRAFEVRLSRARARLRRGMSTPTAEPRSLHPTREATP